MEQQKALQLAFDIYNQLKEENDSYVRVAALKACLSVEESNIQSEATKELLRQASTSMSGKNILNS